MDRLNPEDYHFNDRLSFHTMWYDANSLQKQLLLNFYPCDGTTELIDTQTNRTFLRRATLDGVGLKDMFLGNEIRVYSRQIKIVDYADDRTARYVSKSNEHTVAVVKPDAFDMIGEIIKVIEDNNFRIANLKLCTLTRKDAMEFYDYLKEETYSSFIMEHFISGPIVAMELVGENAVGRLNEILGPVCPVDARKTSPNSLRAMYGTNRAINALHGSLSQQMAAREAKFFFAKYHQQPGLNCHSSACCVIKPHTIKGGNLGKIVSSILNCGFTFSAMEMFYLTNKTANEFLEVYKGVIDDYNALVLSFLDGPCVAVQIFNAEKRDVHGEFRNICGPYDPEVAKKIRPTTLRANFGLDKYKNAVHCTDLPEDVEIELEYFFKILNN
ncbi:nucleoside diphosphate kinase 7-like [Aethina tumida]|uniref:nucleoside diphosphate kinase 7-like n=1 Tax=Aethina tumida TaxID=116153 RepID=UPI0021496BE9|nr:nucleoside diphosphate kinase 7-like [Aethina tumida]